MGTRLTQRTPHGVVYAGKRTKYRNMPEMNRPPLMVAAVREIMDLLAEYEDTGLTPAQIKELLQESLRKN